MPPSLVEELKSLSKKKHFLDLSEEVRSVVRQKYLEQQDPYLFQIKKLKKEIKDGIEQKTKQRVISELNEIKKSVNK